MERASGCRPRGVAVLPRRRSTPRREATRVGAAPRRRTADGGGPRPGAEAPPPFVPGDIREGGGLHRPARTTVGWGAMTVAADVGASSNLETTFQFQGPAASLSTWTGQGTRRWRGPTAGRGAAVALVAAPSPDDLAGRRPGPLRRRPAVPAAPSDAPGGWAAQRTGARPSGGGEGRKWPPPRSRVHRPASRLVENQSAWGTSAAAPLRLARRTRLARSRPTPAAVRRSAPPPGRWSPGRGPLFDARVALQISNCQERHLLTILLFFCPFLYFCAIVFAR